MRRRFYRFCVYSQGFHLRPEAGRFVRSFAIPRPVLWDQYWRFFFTTALARRLTAPRKHSRPVLSEVCPLLYKTVENPDSYSCQHFTRENVCHFMVSPPSNTTLLFYTCVIGIPWVFGMLGVSYRLLFYLQLISGLGFLKPKTEKCKYFLCEEY